VKRCLLLALLVSLGLSATSAAARSAAPTAITYTPYTFGYVKDGFLGAARPRDRIVIATTKRQALGWDRSIAHRMTTAPQYADFKAKALIGVFLLERSAAVGAPFPQLPGPPEVTGVAVTSLAVENGTLSLTLASSPYPVELCGPGVDSPIECFQPFLAPSAAYHAFAIVSVPKAAVAEVRRIVVTRETYDPCTPIQVNVPNLPL
jgi:hypothetical protein